MVRIYEVGPGVCELRAERYGVRLVLCRGTREECLAVLHEQSPPMPVLPVRGRKLCRTAGSVRRG